MTPRRVVALALVLLIVGVACNRRTVRREGERGSQATAFAASGASGATASGAPASGATASSASGPTHQATGATGGPTGASAANPNADLVDVACSIPHDWLLRTWRGDMAGRSAELQILPIEPNFVGAGLPHVGPWPYAQDIPMFWYGPGTIQARGVVDRPVTLAGIAPTEANILHFPFDPIDGSPMTEALVPGAQPPKLLVTLVWDAGGRNVLARWPTSWPNLKAMIPQGTWYDHATVGSSPTSTAQTHAIIGTGDFPDHHGIVAHRLRIGGELTSPWKIGPAYLDEPTLADLYDRAKANRPVVGELGTVSIHLGMLGHGSMWGGGDKDVAVVREELGAETLGAEGNKWNLTPQLAPYYRFPSYVNSVPGFEQDVRAADAADGKIDDKWRGNPMAPLDDGFDTPARIPYQTRVLEQIIEREGFGQDDVPDLLFVNYKMIDYVSHVWTVNSPEMKDVVVAQDAALKTLVDFLNQQVGQGQWAMVLTADHGSIPDPKVSGAFQISATPMAAGINQTFDHDGDATHIVQLIQPTQIFIDTAELKQNGYTLADVARYVMGLTKSQVAQPGVVVPPDQANDLVFQAAFPSALMSHLPCLPEAQK